MKQKTNEELVEEFENANFNEGHSIALNIKPSITPKETFAIKEEILKRMDKKYN